MRVLLQRVRNAHVEIAGEIAGEIDHGLLIFLAVYPDDGEAQVRWLLDKLLGLRVFADEGGKMNLSVQDVHGGVLLVSQFTLAGDARRGRRPGFSAAAPPALAERLTRTSLPSCAGCIPKSPRAGSVLICRFISSTMGR